MQRDLLAENPELQGASETIAKLWKPSFGPDAKSMGSVDLSPQESPRAHLGMAANDLMKHKDEPKSLSFEAEGDPGLPDCLREVGRQEMEMVFLGTGSSQPSKYRNVSAIYIHLFKKGGLLLDCGEGTYAQLKRR